jgi:hypothetical protein
MSSVLEQTTLCTTVTGMAQPGPDGKAWEASSPAFRPLSRGARVVLTSSGLGRTVLCTTKHTPRVYGKQTGTHWVVSSLLLLLLCLGPLTGLTALEWGQTMLCTTKLGLVLLGNLLGSVLDKRQKFEQSLEKVVSAFLKGIH